MAFSDILPCIDQKKTYRYTYLRNESKGIRLTCHDLILMDMQMPEMDSLESTSRIIQEHSL